MLPNPMEIVGPYNYLANRVTQKIGKKGQPDVNVDFLSPLFHPWEISSR